GVLTEQAGQRRAVTHLQCRRESPQPFVGDGRRVGARAVPRIVLRHGRLPELSERFCRSGPVGTAAVGVIRSVVLSVVLSEWWGTAALWSAVGAPRSDADGIRVR